jgi:hypothetical protein
MFKKFAETYTYLRNDRVGKWLLALVWLGIGFAAAFCGIRWMKIVCYTPLLLEYKSFVLAAGAQLPKKRRRRLAPMRTTVTVK